MAEILAARTHALQAQSQAAIAQDDLRGEDPGVRQAALIALGDQAGTVVVMDPQTGRVYSIVNQHWALREGFIPCSTIKPFVALAGLKENLIRPTFPTGQNPLSLSLLDALSRSDNAYFQRVGASLGAERLRRYVTDFGLGQLTGINLPGEIPGRVPEGNTVGTSSSHGTGFDVTALQLAVFTAAIANQGAMYKPQVAADEFQAEPAGDGEGDGGGDFDPGTTTVSFRPILHRQFNITDVERLNLLAGMTGAVEFGTARRSYDPTIQVAGKTGTCTGDAGVRIGLFASFATVEQPKLVVVVITQGVNERGSSAAQIAGHIYQQLADRFQLRIPSSKDIASTHDRR
jgi:cell division protein FtsI/penicillin-binding protein 2